MPPIKIHDATELRAIGHNLSHTGDYQLANDIVVGAWTPIKLASGILLDGDGHRIGPLTSPLFERLSDSTIFELSLECDIKDGADSLGAIARSANTTSFSDINIYGVIRGAGSTGAFAGDMTECASERCSNFASVSGCAGTGGLCGIAAMCQFIDCRNLGSVKACSGCAGGIAGSIIEGGLCQSCANDGAIMTEGARAGGIAGQIISKSSTGKDSEIMITSCQNQGEIIAGVDAGGICGAGIGSVIKIEGSTNLAAITSNLTHAGGICGRVEGGAIITGNRSCVKVTAKIAAAGGIVGGAEGPATIKDSTIDGAIIRAQTGAHRILGIAPPNIHDIVLLGNKAAVRARISTSIEDPGFQVADDDPNSRADGLDGLSYTCAAGLVPADCFECVKPESEGALSDCDWDNALKEMLKGLSGN